MSFCKSTVYTTQSYDKNEKKTYKNKPRYNKGYNRKNYYLRKSSAKKPYLDRNRHVRKYRTERNYKNKLECFTCGSAEYLANTCPKRINNRTKNSQLIEDFQETLINVDEYMSDNESIYSIVSMETEENTQIDSSESEEEELINEIGLEKLNLEEIQVNTLVNISEECNHDFEKNKGLDSNQCFICKWYPSKDRRAKCKSCYLEGCILCIEREFKIKINREEKCQGINDPTLNTRVMALEIRINELEKRIQKMEKGKQKDNEENIAEFIDDEELMSIENYDTLICNEDKKLSTIKILARIKIEDYEIETLALVDSGCTRCIINKKIVPPNLIKT